MPTDAADGHDQEADDAECETEEKNVHCRAALSVVNAPSHAAPPGAGIRRRCATWVIEITRRRSAQCHRRDVDPEAKSGPTVELARRPTVTPRMARRTNWRFPLQFVQRVGRQRRPPSDGRPPSHRRAIAELSPSYTAGPPRGPCAGAGLFLLFAHDLLTVVGGAR